MANFKLAVSYDDINATINTLNELKKRLDAILTEQVELINKMPEIYGGTNGDEAFKRLTDHSIKWYKAYIKAIEKRVKFLEDLILKHKEYDASIIKEIDERLAYVEE